ncbi:peptidoglycan editing factor PgeF [Anaerolinea thermophila]|uniref:Purine nucleoside phosphorylase n=1 Tax=Anaerolinea thermophila (strain DSM 14523 / JCM 11388 / NBRC 100420 / UNI-1) TaxID=926569 RepID=E8N608_ANATU|nr:peptidoglycan editing factor PgeF [Anaerolinea thermophila]BAJ63872.1 hypothetical protein ANT_18460 [Anaerolinea thermophila UNI-1]
MRYVSSGEVRFLKADLLDTEPIFHGFFTRHGGVSPSPWASLNMATSVGDSRENVLENRARALRALTPEPRGIFDVWQVHSNRVVYTRQPRSLGEPHQQADAIITDNPEVVLLMMFADCVPILLFDPGHHAVGIAHAGWKGTVAKVARESVLSMKQAFGTKPEDLLAVIGPSICPEHYAVGSEVTHAVREAFGNDSSEVLLQENGVISLDLWRANQIILTQAGVLADHIQTVEICTAEHTRDWYSHRAEMGKTGRFAAMIGLR